jgi:hypothetical protein
MSAPLRPGLAPSPIVGAPAWRVRQSGRLHARQRNPGPGGGGPRLGVKANRVYISHGLLARRRRASTLDLTTVLTTTVTTVVVPATPPTGPFGADLAWLLRLPAPGSVGVRGSSPLSSTEIPQVIPEGAGPGQDQPLCCFGSFCELPCPGWARRSRRRGQGLGGARPRSGRRALTAAPFGACCSGQGGRNCLSCFRLG